MFFPNLIDLVLHYLDMYSKHDKLTSRGGVIPHDKVWLKLGGDHGGGSFKFVFQIANKERPNSLGNTIPISIFECHDTAADNALCICHTNPEAAERDRLAGEII